MSILTTAFTLWGPCKGNKEKDLPDSIHNNRKKRSFRIGIEVAILQDFHQGVDDLVLC